MKDIGVTLGDPAGAGPEILLRAVAHFGGRRRLRVFGDRGLIERLAQGAQGTEGLEIVQAGPELSADFARGRWSEVGARASVEYLRAAAAQLRAGRLRALVTGPISKKSLSFCGEPGPGQTEWLAQQLGAELAVMCFWSPSFWLALVTTHPPLRRVAAELDAGRLACLVQVVVRELGPLLGGSPRLALAALNPHGEEDGRPGREEEEILRPAVEKLRAQGVDIVGPLAGDTVFFQARQGQFDLVVSPYHDQGLAALKTLHFFEAVHVTLGLPCVRTSPDHGPAYDQVGGAPDFTSMLRALELAERLLQARQSYGG